MPYSTGYLKGEIKEHFLKNCAPHIAILDAGAGCGTYSHLLRQNYSNIDGLEIFPKYAEMFDLKNKYRQLFIADIRNFDIDEYDYIILGDIIEHMSFEDANKLLEKINRKDKLCLVGVPYMYEQGAEFDNVHETHLQPDLTQEIFLQRYPYMKLLMGNHEYGYYVNYEFI
jgi:hypothetical protein